MMKRNEKKFLIGAHISIEGGLYKAFQRAKLIGCSVLQIFTKSNRQWFAKPLLKNDTNLFKETRKKSEVVSVTTHASYLINLASNNEETRTRSINALKKELDRCHELEIEYLVFHPGSHIKQGEEKGLKLIIEGINKVLSQTNSTTMLLLETTAGQGTVLGKTFEEIAFIRKNIHNKERVGVCLDTCHIFAAGYDMRTKETYQSTLNFFDSTIGLQHLKVFHINDSKKELSSYVDRHADIGKGEIGEKGFALLFNDERFFDIPKILETPKETLDDDIRNITTIKNLLTETTKKKLNIKKD